MQNARMSRRQGRVSARSRDNYLMTHRRYISFEKLIWRELGEFPPKDARREHLLVEYWEVFEANDCALGRFSSRKKQGRLFGVEKRQAAIFLFSPSSYPSLIALYHSPPIFSRQELSCPGITTPADSPKPLACVKLTERPQGRSIGRDVIGATQ